MTKSRTRSKINRTRLICGIGLIVIGCLSTGIGFWYAASWDVYAIIGGLISLIAGGIVAQQSGEHVFEALLNSVFGANF